MSLVIDIALVLIIAFFIWKGFRNGFIRSILGVVAIIVAIYGANFVAKTYSGEFSGVLEPFVSGVIDNAVSDAILGSDGEGAQADVSGESGGGAAEDGGTSEVFEISFEALRNIGVSKEAAGLLAEKVGGQIKSVGQQLTASLTENLCASLAYIAVFAIAFIVISIVFAIIGNLINLAYILPGIETADRLIGLALGLVKGALIVLAIAVVIRYFGLLSPETIDRTTLLKFITDANPLADILGI